MTIGHNEQVRTWTIGLLQVVAVSWFVVLLFGPLLPGSLGGPLYGVGSLICHQRPERSFHLIAAQLPVCARCIGIYAGLACGAFVALVAAGERTRWTQYFRQLTVRQLRHRAWLAAMPTVCTVLAELTGAWQPSNAVRAVAGLPLGVVVAVVVTAALGGLHYPRCPPQASTASSLPPPNI